MKTKFHKVKGFNRRDLAVKFAEMGLNKGAEIGVRTGFYSEVLCKANPDLHLLSVDPYDVVYGDYRSNSVGYEQTRKFFEEAKKRLAPYNCEIIEKESIDAVRDVPYESLDFVYIDGSHELDWVMVDIIEWGKRIRKGGIISGHDYYRFRVGNVTDAVDVYTYAHKVKDVYLTDERMASFWFEKTW